MNALQSKLADFAAGSLDYVVHLGAGDGSILSTYQTLAPGHLVLVEGDPERGSALQEAVGNRDGVEVRQLVVSAGGEPVRWHRYSLPQLNGPLAVSGLLQVYPRLREESTAVTESVALTELLARLAWPDGEPERRLLAIDLPGQSAELLQSLPPELLEGYGQILLAGVGKGMLAGASALEKAVALLERRGFHLREIERDNEPLWPVARLELDTEAVERRRNTQRIAFLERTLAARDLEVEELRRAAEERTAKSQFSLEQQTQQLREQQALLGQMQDDLEAETATRIQQASRLDAALNRCAELEAERLALEQGVAHERALQEEHARTVDRLSAELEAESKRRAKAEEHSGSLQQQIANLGARNKLLHANNVELTATGKELGRRVAQQDDQLGKLKQVIEARERKIEEITAALKTEREGSKEREQQVGRLKSELAAEASRREKLEQAVAEAKQQLGELSERNRSLHSNNVELTATNKELSRKSIALSEQSSGLQAEIARLKSELAAETGKREELDEALSGAQEQMRELSNRNRSLHANNVDLTASCKELNRKVATLEEQLSKLQSVLEARVARISELDSALSSKLAEAKDSSQALARLTADSAKLKQQLQDALAGCDGLRRELDAAVQIRNGLETQLASKSQEIAELNEAREQQAKIALERALQRSAQLDALRTERDRLVEQLREADRRDTQKATEIEQFGVVVAQLNAELAKLRESTVKDQRLLFEQRAQVEGLGRMLDEQRRLAIEWQRRSQQTLSMPHSGEMVRGGLSIRSMSPESAINHAAAGNERLATARVDDSDVVRRLESELSWHKDRYGKLKQELVKAESQLALITELMRDKVL